MNHYAGTDLSMETPRARVVDGDGRKIGAQCATSTPKSIAAALHYHGPVERAVIEMGRMNPSLKPSRDNRQSLCKLQI